MLFRQNVTTTATSPNGSDEVPDSTENDGMRSELTRIANHIKTALGCMYGREAFYKRALAAELTMMQWDVSVEASMPVVYTTLQGNMVSVGNIFIDIIAEHQHHGKFFIELKNVKNITSKHIQQAKFYARSLGINGYVLNFTTENHTIEIQHIEN